MMKEAGLLVTVSGMDAPGITTELTGILGASGVRILDMGQSVLHGLLSLTILFDSSADTNKSILKDLLFKSAELGLKLEFQVVNLEQFRQSQQKDKAFQYAATLIGDPVSASALHHVTRVLADHNLNIDGIRRLSEHEFSCVELQASSDRAISVRELHKKLLILSREQGIDIALQAEGLFRRAKRLVVMDVDSTLIENEVIDEFARECGVYDEVSAITHEAMKGQIPFDESLKRRVSKLEGLTLQQVDRVYDRVKLTKGARELIQVLKVLGYKIAIISGGFTHITDRLKRELGIDYAYANSLELNSEGKATGRVIPPIVNAQRKADLLEVIAQQENISLDQVIAIGDGANDLLMLEKAGLGIAFSAKPIVSERADLALHRRNLKSVFYLLGLTSRDIRQALKEA